MAAKRKRKRRARAEPAPREELEAALEVYRTACLRVERAGKSAPRALRVLSRADLERRAERAAKAELGRRAARRALHLAAERAALA